MFQFHLFKVWDMVLPDVPYAVVMDNIEFIIKHEQVIANSDVVRKVITVLQDVGRAVNGKIHPLLVVILRTFY